MFRLASVMLMLMFFVSGCIKTEGLLQRDPTANAYYKFDSRDLRMCRGETSNCYTLAPIVSVRYKLQPMEEQYGQRVAGPNYPLNFARMLINPPANSYTPDAQADGRFYHLPINAYTDAAWSSLEAVYAAYYDN